ncbi:hypothetical protein VE01_10364 [Pseudogymnoascus verrucosus]|uniref:Rhodopsin domain-containing protein n=1 Tax=Pseudogymnoascus verrucosus TaxID=342668 RepID=A0A1B8G6Y6_9PEZI|nr:uncharacterized protein VE01_10364 [Pseudogymnoascus verrucosus]OBT91594.1 hypothetical protein VE01_10364 [Pseudogymnoascus verrucosus]
MSEESDPNPLAALSPPHWVISDTDHGGYVVIANWTMMCFMVITVIVRLLRKLSIRSWSLDDNLIAAAGAFGLIQCGILHKAVLAGLGRHESSLLDGEIDMYNKYNYTYQILFIITTVLAKMSLLLFITRLTPNVATIRVGRIILCLIATWGVATVIAFAFQCSLPQPWNNISGVCKNQAALYYAAGIIDIITDIALTILPVVILWGVQIQRRKRAIVMLVFMARMLVCLAEIPRLIYLSRYIGSTDKPWYGANVAIWTQAVTHLSIVTACIPSLQHLLASMQSGVFNTALPAGFEGGLSYTLESTGSGGMSRELYGSKRVGTTRTTVESGTQPPRSESKTRLVVDGGIYKTTEFVLNNVDNDQDSGARKRGPPAGRTG